MIKLDISTRKWKTISKKNIVKCSSFVLKKGNQVLKRKKKYSEFQNSFDVLICDNLEKIIKSF